MFKFTRNIIYTFSKVSRYMKILGVNSKSSPKEIKDMYIKLVKEYHPDTGKVKDSEKFKEVLQAYNFLSNKDNLNEQYHQEQKQQRNNYTRQQQQRRYQESEAQRIRRETYSHFNQKERPRREPNEQDWRRGRFDSLLKSLMAAPELVICTILFWALLIGWSYPSNQNKAFYSVQEKVFETEAEEIQYYRKLQRKKLQQQRRYADLNYKSRYNNKARDQ